MFSTLISTNSETLINTLQNNLQKINEWLKCLDLKRSLEKTQLIIFDKYTIPNSVEILIDDHTLKNVSDVKLLGIIWNL